MKWLLSTRLAGPLALACWHSVSPTCPGQSVEWPRFRGPNGSGVSEARGVPAEFGAGKNLSWQVNVPEGSSSPIMAGNRIFLTGYEGQRRLMLCFDRLSGRGLWERSIEVGRTERKSPPDDPAS